MQCSISIIDILIKDNSTEYKNDDATCCCIVILGSVVDKKFERQQKTNLRTSVLTPR